MKQIILILFLILNIRLITHKVYIQEKQVNGWSYLEIQYIKTDTTTVGKEFIFNLDGEFNEDSTEFITTKTIQVSSKK